MFGYVRSARPEMKIREYDTYCAAYCGLCHAMGKCTGQLSRATLNYDFVFMCLVRSVLEKEKISFSMRRCIVHPIKKRQIMNLTPSLQYCAKASVSLASYKAEDDKTDEKRYKRLIYEATFPFFKHFRKKASLPKLNNVIRDTLDQLSRLESERCASLDMTAELFGQLLGEVFCYGLESDARKIAYEIGFHTGKFIYAADAADDYEKDLADGSYNPIVCMYGNEFTPERKNSIKTALLCELSRLEAAVALVDFSDYRDIEGIINNIIYLGMPMQMDKALTQRKDNRSERKQKAK